MEVLIKSKLGNYISTIVIGKKFTMTGLIMLSQLGNNIAKSII